MKDFVGIGGRLGLICAVAALVLGLVNSVTEPKIAEIKAQKLQEALSAVAPEGEIGEEVAGDNPVVAGYYPVTREGRAVGYVLNLQASGYAGGMKVLASYTADGNVLDARLMDNDETPGLGKEAEKPDYMQKYAGKGPMIPCPPKRASSARPSRMKFPEPPLLSAASAAPCRPARIL